MDYGEILHTATQKDPGKKQIQYYSTKFSAPKKQQRSTTPSVNVQKFLARKEAEEKKKLQEAKKMKDKLLELRSHDKKATRRVNVMLKRTKSANQAVIEEAHDEDNTAVTLAGPSQPDEDDYGYVSQESAAYYNKMMEKYNKMPEEPKFGTEKRKISTNLESTREQMKAALAKDQEEANMPHRRKRKRTEPEGTGSTSEKIVHSPVYEEEKKPPPKPKFKPAPLVNFEDLLKLAAKKQHEPIIIEPKKVDEERPLTKKQRREIESEKAYLQQKEERRESQARAAEGKPAAKIPKLSNGQSQSNPTIPKKAILSDTKVPHKSSAVRPEMKTAVRNANVKPEAKKLPIVQQKSNIVDKTFKKPEVPNGRDGILKKPNGMKPGLPVNGKPKEFPPRDLLKKRLEDGKPKVLNGKPKEFPPRDIKPKQFPPADLKPKQFPPADLKPKQFPPSDVRRKEFPPRDLKKKPMLNNKRRIIDDDDEDYDSEMDDFIDDGPEGEEDYSSAIRDIFGYDKRKYSYADDEEADNMESTFAQQMREECISTKLGIREDLEDMKREEEHKKLKAQRKKGRW